jgi:hypothetical protein
MLNAAMANPGPIQQQPAAVPPQQVDEHKLEERIVSNFDARQWLATKPRHLQQDSPHQQRVLAGMMARIQATEAVGGRVSYQEAYDAELWANPETRDELLQEQENRKRIETAEAAKAKASTLPKAKAAAVSIKASPVDASTRGQGTRTLRQTIEDAIAESQRT